MLGTLINTAAVLAGSTIGLLLRSRMPKKINEIVFQANGLISIALGVTLCLKTANFILLIFSLVLGAVVGEMLGLENKLEKFSDFLKRKTKSDNSRFSEGLITAFLMFCMGSMTILGAIEEGLGNFPNLLLAKSVLDGVAAIALSASLGLGVAFSVVPLIVYQGGLTLLAFWLGNFIPESIMNELTAVGGVLMIGLGINILEIKKLRILNMIPAIVFVVVLAFLFMS